MINTNFQGPSTLFNQSAFPENAHTPPLNLEFPVGEVGGGGV